MKKILLPLGIVLAGAATGAGSALAVRHFTGSPQKTPKAASPLVFVTVAKIVAPLVLSDGGLAGYVSFDVDLQVDEPAQADVTGKLPLLLHAINMRSYRSPLATGHDGMLPDIGGLRTLVAAACVEAFGKSTVHRIAITRAEPI